MKTVLKIINLLKLYERHIGTATELAYACLLCKVEF